MDRIVQKKCVIVADEELLVGLLANTAAMAKNGAKTDYTYLGLESTAVRRRLTC